MSSEERNRRMKFGQDVPRSWISDFNMTHGGAPDERSEFQVGKMISDEEALKMHYELKSRSRLIEKRLRQRRLNKDIQLTQKIVAFLFVFIGTIAAGAIGFGIGAALGLVLLAVRLEF